MKKTTDKVVVMVGWVDDATTTRVGQQAEKYLAQMKSVDTPCEKALEDFYVALTRVQPRLTESLSCTIEIEREALDDFAIEVGRFFVEYQAHHGGFCFDYPDDAIVPVNMLIHDLRTRVTTFWLLHWNPHEENFIRLIKPEGQFKIEYTFEEKSTWPAFLTKS